MDGSRHRLTFPTYSFAIEFPQQFKNITIIPIFSHGNGSIDNLTLTEALQQKTATVTEVSASGQVPYVHATKTSELSLLLVEGDWSW